MGGVADEPVPRLAAWHAHPGGHRRHAPRLRRHPRHRRGRPGRRPGHAPRPARRDAEGPGGREHVGPVALRPSLRPGRPPRRRGPGRRRGRDARAAARHRPRRHGARPRERGRGARRRISRLQRGRGRQDARRRGERRLHRDGTDARERAAPGRAQRCGRAGLPLRQGARPRGPRPRRGRQPVPALRGHARPVRGVGHRRLLRRPPRAARRQGDAPRGRDRAAARIAPSGAVDCRLDAPAADQPRSREPHAHLRDGDRLARAAAAPQGRVPRRRPQPGGNLRHRLRQHGAADAPQRPGGGGEVRGPRPPLGRPLAGRLRRQPPERLQVRPRDPRSRDAADAPEGLDLP